MQINGVDGDDGGLTVDAMNGRDWEMTNARLCTEHNAHAHMMIYRLWVHNSDRVAYRQTVSKQNSPATKPQLLCHTLENATIGTI